MEKGKSTFELLPDRTQITQSGILAELLDSKYNVKYSLSVSAVDGGIFRVKINELNPSASRFEVPYVLVAEPSLQTLVASLLLMITASIAEWSEWFACD